MHAGAWQYLLFAVTQPIYVFPSSRSRCSLGLVFSPTAGELPRTQRHIYPHVLPEIGEQTEETGEKQSAERDFIIWWSEIPEEYNRENTQII